MTMKAYQLCRIHAGVFQEDGNRKLTLQARLQPIYRGKFTYLFSVFTEAYKNL